MEAAYRKFSKQGVVFVFIAGGGDTEASARKYLRAHRYNWPTGVDRSDRIAAQYRVRGWPTTVFIDRQGRKKLQNVGAMSEAAYARAIKQIL